MAETTLLSAEQRAKLADLCHEIMSMVGHTNHEYDTKVWDTCEEWHDHYRWLDGGDVFETVGFRYVVSDSKNAVVGDPSSVPILGRFATEQEAAEFIGTLPEYHTGRYNLDGPER